MSECDCVKPQQLEGIGPLGAVGPWVKHIYIYICKMCRISAFWFCFKVMNVC